MLPHQQAWPPSYQIKRYRQARSVKLRITPRHELIVSVPLRFSAKQIPSILEENKEWIIRQFLLLPQKIEEKLPDYVELLFVNEKWPIIYFKTDTPALRLLQRPDKQIAIYGDIENTALVKALLQKWVKKKAKEILIPFLIEISKECDLAFSRSRVRSATSIWGSCTHEKAISLNFKLIFLPPHLVRYVMVHELCHTINLNHSKQFWQLVEKYDPLYKAHIKLIRNTDINIPAWAH